jgi:ornithine cyclodeaminase/alanine dehydrogenase-like protein (mu-crystallin family)
MIVLDRDQTAAALDPLRVLDAVARALVAVSRDEVSAPPRIAAFSPNGLVGAMPAYVPGIGLAAKLVSVFADPAAAGRSTHRGIVAVFDPADGRPVAILDAEPLTAVRTAASATIGMQHLANPSPARIAVIGTGVQARSQLALLAAIGCTARIVVGGRDLDRAAAVAGPGMEVDTIEGAVRGADVVFCCTGATSPVVRRGWLSPGVHVSSIGGSHGHEIDAETVRDASVFVEWPGAATSAPPAGAYEIQGRDVTLIGSVVDGQHPGRRDPAELTVYKSTGHAALDVAAACVALAP